MRDRAIKSYDIAGMQAWAANLLNWHRDALPRLSFGNCGTVLGHCSARDPVIYGRLARAASCAAIRYSAAPRA
jgi:hypothetical protein